MKIYLKTTVFFIVMLALIANSMLANTTIQMEKYKGVYRVPCTVNGAKMKFIFDTGASSISMSLSMAEYLYDNGYLVDDDLVSLGESTTADGRIVDHIKINIRDLEIGGIHIQNIQAVVQTSLDAPLLLGQSALSQIGNYSISEDKLIITGPKSLGINWYDTPQVELSISEADKDLYLKGIDLYNRNIYHQAIYIFSDLEARGFLPDEGKMYLAYAYYNIDEYEKAIQKATTITDLSWWKPNFKTPQILVGGCYYKLGNTEESISYLEQALCWFDCGDKDLCVIYLTLSCDYYDLENYDQCIKDAWKAFEYFAKYYKLTRKSLWNMCTGAGPIDEKLNTSVLDSILYMIVNGNYCHDLWTETKANNMRKIFAKKGFKSFIQYCNQNGIKY